MFWLCTTGQWANCQLFWRT